MHRQDINLSTLASVFEKNNTLAERKTVPELGWSSPAISLSMVDLPMPLGPTTAPQFEKPNTQK